MHRRSFLKGASLSVLTAIGDNAQTSTPNLRIAYGGIGIECSTYSRLRTRMDEFTILRGADVTSNVRFQFLKRYPITFMPTLVATAVPGGPVERKTYEAIKSEFLERLNALLPLDGLYLPMHGAMFVDGMQDAEADWYRAARKVVGPDCLLSASYDLHGNISQPIIDTLDMLSAFRTAPHIDREETMLRATDMLLHCLREKIRPTLLWAPIPVLMPGERSSTEWEPGKRLWAQLPALNREPGILDVSMLVGYVWADEPDPPPQWLSPAPPPTLSAKSPPILRSNIGTPAPNSNSEPKPAPLTNASSAPSPRRRNLRFWRTPAITQPAAAIAIKPRFWNRCCATKRRMSCSPASPIVPRPRLATRRAWARDSSFHRSHARSQSQPAGQGGSRGQVSACRN